MAKNKEFNYELTEREQLKLGFSALGDLFSIYNSLSTGRTLAANYDFSAFMEGFNATTLRQDMQTILESANREANVTREAGLRERGEQLTTMSSSGFAVESKSFQNILNETDRNIEENVAYIRENAMKQYAKQEYQARGLEIQADYEKKAAKAAKKSSRTNALLSAISSAAKLGFGYTYGD